MQASTEFHTEAEQFRSRAGAIEAEHARVLLLQLSQAWETLAQAWDSLEGETAQAEEVRH